MATEAHELVEIVTDEREVSRLHDLYFWAPRLQFAEQSMGKLENDEMVMLHL